MSDLVLSRIITAATVAISLTACGAFAPQNNLAASSSSSRSSQDNNLLSRNALFGFGQVDEKLSATFGGGGGNSNSNALMKKAKDIVDNKSGFYSSYEADVFSEDFVFRGPFVGPLNKKDYLATMDAFGIYKAFPDINPNSWGYSIDPNDPNRVWFMVRQTGTFEGGDNLAPGTLNIKPNGAKLEGCPETYSLIFDEEQKVKHLTVGYVADRFDGNTGGLGAAFGIFELIGLSLPKPGPVLQFAQWFGSEVVRTPPLSYSTDVPEWYIQEKGKDKAGQGY